MNEKLIRNLLVEPKESPFKKKSEEKEDQKQSLLEIIPQDEKNLLMEG